MDACVANGLAAVLGIIFTMVKVIVFASIVVSWVGDPSNRIVQMIYSVSEPIYRPLRPLTSKIPGPIDWTPMVLLLLIVFLEGSVIGMLARAGVGCQTGF